MGSSKTYQYSTKQKSFARTAKALGHPARVAIVQHLAESGLGNNSDFIRVTKLDDATVSQHLAELRSAGIIIGGFIGNRHYYQLAAEAGKAVEELNLIFRGGC